MRLAHTAPPSRPLGDDESQQRRGGSLEPSHMSELVEEASDESFPASDAPAWASINAA